MSSRARTRTAPRPGPAVNISTRRTTGLCRERPARVRPIGRQPGDGSCTSAARSPEANSGLSVTDARRALVHRERGIWGIVVGGRDDRFHRRSAIAPERPPTETVVAPRASPQTRTASPASPSSSRALHRPRPHRAGTLWHDGSATRSPPLFRAFTELLRHCRIFFASHALIG